MNAGMYHEDLSPVGLLVQDGVEKAPIETRDGEGNFFLKPNGVLSIGPDGSVSIMETGAYLATQALTPASATQSGPMLVIGGEIHPNFEQNGIVALRSATAPACATRTRCCWRFRWRRSASAASRGCSATRLAARMRCSSTA